jgi:hypothetical protein
MIFRPPDASDPGLPSRHPPKNPEPGGELRIPLLAAALARLLELSEIFVYRGFSKCFQAFCALEDFVGEPVVNQVI